MKSGLIKICVLLLIFVCFSACQKKITVLKKPTVDAVRLFTVAENFFNSRDFDKALEKYKEYVKKFPESSQAPSSLFKIGFIYYSKKEYSNARKAYKQLIDYYPETSYIPDVMVNTLTSYYYEGDYEKVFEYGSRIPDDLKPSDYLPRKYSVIGNASIESGHFKKGFEAYFLVYKYSKDQEKKNILIKLKSIISQLKADEMISLVEKTDVETVRSYLLYNISLIYYKENKIDDAINYLTLFIDLFPMHENTALAVSILEQLKVKQKKAVSKWLGYLS